MGTWQFILNNQTVHWSDEMFEIFDRDRSNGNPSFSEVHDSIHINDRFQWELMINQVSIDGKYSEVTLRIYDRNDETKWITMSAVGVYEDRVLVSIRGECQDVTQMKKREALQSFRF